MRRGNLKQAAIPKRTENVAMFGHSTPVCIPAAVCGVPGWADCGCCHRGRPEHVHGRDGHPGHPLQVDLRMPLQPAMLLNLLALRTGHRGSSGSIILP